MGELEQVVAELLLAGAPGEVGVALVVADGTETVHHRRSGECLGEEQHTGVEPAYLGEQSLPEGERLGVRVVDAEDADAVVHPVADHAQHLGVDAWGSLSKLTG